jgi:hypothetical protein
VKYLNEELFVPSFAEIVTNYIIRRFNYRTHLVNQDVSHLFSAQVITLVKFEVLMI